MNVQGGEQTNQLSEVIYLSSKLENAQIPDGLKQKIDLQLKRLRRMARQGQSAGEYESVAKYIDWCLAFPWGRYVQDNLDLNKARTIMDSMHYGSNEVKEVVMEYLAVLGRKTRAQDTHYTAPVLAFVGVQGAGKTSLAKAIAGALGRPFFRLPLGALGSSVELRGSSASMLDGHPGQIVQALVRAQCMNPVILLDEFDKVSGDDSARKDFMAIMLEILDPAQNHSFTDRYIDYPIDLSKIMFIATANRFKTISRELLDRLEFIEFPDYTLQEKTQIAKSFLFPKVIGYSGLQSGELQIGDDAWPILVEAYGKDQGVRRLEQNLKKLARVVVKDIALGKSQSVLITAQNASEFTKYKLPSVEDVRYKDFTESKDATPKVDYELYPSEDKASNVATAMPATTSTSPLTQNTPQSAPPVFPQTSATQPQSQP